jgi:hypothetical protein
MALMMLATSSMMSTDTPAALAFVVTPVLVWNKEPEQM